ncbi:hypothetical protein ACQKMI_16685 [Lysinibacillus sp. NPDC097214]|uniref:hypothetical protein n=1 Tax=Lysinibacillus sp. NPDC097214 TaxID=3390584 RepID=UPI003CFC44CD
MKKDARYSCYPFMREKASTVDFEIRTDSLTTHIGVALAAVKKETVEVVAADLLAILPMAYHVNGSVRGKLAVTEGDLTWLSDRYDFYVSHVKDEIQNFVLPQGIEAATTLHLCRSEAKKSYRVLHKVSEEREVPAILFDYLGLLANVFFVMAVYMNQHAGIAEIPFISKSYPMKKKKENQ